MKYIKLYSKESPLYSYPVSLFKNISTIAYIYLRTYILTVNLEY